jgi:acyl transferase domain-containing protein
MNAIVERDLQHEVIKVVQTTLKLPSDDLDIDAGLDTFGVDSINAMELMENLSNTFKMAVTPTEFVEVDTIRELTDLIEKSLIEDVRSEEVHQHSGGAAAPPMVPEARVRQALDFFSTHYGIDLGERQFSSVGDAVDELIAKHGGELVQQYGVDVGRERSLFGAGAGALRRHDVAIVGIGCRLPDAATPQTFWNNLIEGRNSIKEIPKSRWDWQDVYDESIKHGKTVSRWGALIDDVDCFDPGFFKIDETEAVTMDPQERLLLQESYHALEDAGIDIAQIAGTNVGVFIGYEYAEYEQYLRRNAHLLDGPLPLSSSSPTYYLANRISFALDLCGSSESFNVNCASSAVAINRAYYSLLNEESDAALVGAVSLNLFADDYVTASQFGLLSPDGTSGVFDDDANGYTRGEGVTVVVLKRLEDAKRDNDQIYAVIKASHQNNRGGGRNIVEVKHESITRVLSACYEKAGLPADAVDYIEVDGYASKWADSFEFEGVKNVFKDIERNGKFCALGSLKGNIGNVESVSGIANLIKLALSLHHKQFPPTISKKKLNSFIDIDSNAHPLYIADSAIAFDDIRTDAATPIRAGINSFADSGVNVHILLEEYMPEQSADAGQRVDGPQLFVLSASDAERLEAYVDSYIDFLTDGTERPFANLVYTAQMGRKALSARLAVIAASPQELLEKLSAAKRADLHAQAGLEKRGIFYADRRMGQSAQVSLITEDMANTQMALSLQSGQWKPIALLWVNGVDMPWQMIWRNKPVTRLPLPTYPFAKKRYWVELAGTPLPTRAGVPKRAAQTAAAMAQTRDDAPEERSEYVIFATDQQVPGFVDMHPEEKIELFIKQACIKHLNRAVDEVETDVDFIELGLDSVAVTDIIVKVDELFDINLSPSVLFKYPEIGTLAKYLLETYPERAERLVVASAESAAAVELVHAANAGDADDPSSEPQASPSDIIVPMQRKGDRLPIHAVPGADGGILSFRRLSQALGDKQPFYGLEAVGLNGRARPLESIEAVAKLNVEAIKTAQPNDPYRLLGYSNGGIVAYEIARILIENDEEVASLMMIDSVSPLVPGPDMASETAAVFRHLVATLGGSLELDAEALRRIPEEQWGEYLYGKLQERGFDLAKKQFMASFAVSSNSERYCRSYRPEGLLGKVDVVLFRATDGYRNLPPDYGWNSLLEKPLRSYEIKADHFSIIDQEPIKEVAKKINLLGRKLVKR